MDTTHSSFSTRIKVGVFTLMGLLTLAVITVIVNNRPYWWRPCQLVKISVDDATGLKTKSPIRSLGIDIGYLKSVELTETKVNLGICITAPVEVLPDTHAYIRGEGFLGDKFVELKPVKYVGDRSENQGLPSEEIQSEISVVGEVSSVFPFLERVWNGIVPSARAETPAASKNPELGQISGSGKKGGREIPVGEESQDVQHLVHRVDDLVQEVKGLTENLKEAINPEEMRRTMKQLNETLNSASRTISPEGGLNQTAQRTLGKLEDAIEQLRDMMVRVNKGEGSVGMLLNDPTYAEEIHQAIKNVNRLLNRVGDVEFRVDIGGAEFPNLNGGASGGRAWFNLGIWPHRDRYYLLGIAADPRGQITNSTTTTTSGGISVVTQTQTVTTTSLMITAMLGKIFLDRIDLSVGALYGDGAGSVNFLLGPSGSERRYSLRSDVYFRNSGSPIDLRVYATAYPFEELSLKPFQNLYVRAGLESIIYDGVKNWFFGGGITFTDEDIKLLFVLK